MERKKCNKCGVVQLEKEFYKQHNEKRLTTCRTCMNKVGREWYYANKKRIRELRPLYYVWANIKRRCKNPSDKAFGRYGGRGIKVCKEWEKYENFEKDMMPIWKYETFFYNKDQLSLDRIDNNKGYYKENCRFTGAIQQSNNTRANRLFTYNRASFTLPQWARLIGIKRSTLSMRLYQYKWPIEKALTYSIT
jgi:hypothetical protein